MTTTAPVSVAVEGESDVGMANALLAHVGLSRARCLVKRGAANLDKLIPGLARTTIHNPWIVFRDSDGKCPVHLREQLVGSRSHGDGFELRLACTMTEAWLLADVRGFSAYFKVPMIRLPQAPDDLPHAKRELLVLCQRHSPRSIRGDMVRPDGTTGPLYVQRINEFASRHWDVKQACVRSPSLARSVTRLAALRNELLARSPR
ncbi:hypothetical protein [Actinomyces sp.]|uniref:hypothetical protein n=1 Tax=Actinomyces sp. TaxID=29317 RepID=UPI0026DAEF32|nr:hypothetical protein [Actinomyces sp.]MDO4899519.1 hypothetical protein [Actinomyces sp.]